MKNEKFSKFLLFLNQKINYTFCTRIQKMSFIFHIWLMQWKKKNEANFFWLYFDLKPISKNENQNFRTKFLISNQKINFIKFFHFSILIIKLKNEKLKIFNIYFVFKSKNELYFWYTDWNSITDFWF